MKNLKILITNIQDELAVEKKIHQNFKVKLSPDGFTGKFDKMSTEELTSVLHNTF